MNRIYKYPVGGLEKIILELPFGFTVLTLQMQNGAPFIWAMVDPQARKEKWRILTVATGQLFEDPNAGYCGTYQDAGYVWHVFLKKEK